MKALTIISAAFAVICLNTSERSGCETPRGIGSSLLLTATEVGTQELALWPALRF